MAFEHQHGADDDATYAARRHTAPETPVLPAPLTLLGGSRGAGVCANGVCEIPEG
ncbi:hypothetical protein [Microbacterium sp. Marseille-Q6965]|uniref:hypothetical protein n=1 Tax=Microbacterium sp. Marseille-Q6965 TaxID=2965072 RepID=UPI0021B79073|nr:hypothetical protein [Microbacterium sp. Marseille-Q6965]